MLPCVFRPAIEPCSSLSPLTGFAYNVLNRISMPNASRLSLPISLVSCKLKCYAVRMAPKKAVFPRRSRCPLNASVEMLGDRWSLLIIRDMMVFGYRGFKEFLNSHERIATNILADRLKRLEKYGIISAAPDPSDGRKLIYSLTAKGLDLAPVLTEMVLWAAAHADTGNQALVRLIRKDKEHFLAEVRKRFADLGKRSS